MTTRYERLSSRSRRLEVVAAVAAAVFTVAMCRIVPDRTAAAVPFTADVGYAAEAVPSGAATAGRTGPGGPLPRSAPVHVRIAGTGVDADVLTSREAGPDLPVAPPRQTMQIAWDATGPAPGEPGAAVLVGHLDSRDGPAAFAGLGGLRAGAPIAVGRADGRTARFEVYAVERYGKGGLPDDLALASVPDEAGPQLRLVASGGGWTEGAADDVSVVAFAHAARR